MISQVYTGLFIASLIMLFLLIILFQNRISVYYALFFFAVVLCNLGYMQIVAATDVKMAIFSNQLVYLGASFSPFFAMACVADLCKIKLKRWMEWTSILFGGVIIFLTSTIGTFDLYYKNVRLVKYNGFSFIEKDYGPLHILYPIYLCVAVALALGMIFYTFKAKKDVSHTTSVMLFITFTMTVILYITEKVVKVRFEFIPFAYVAMELVIIILLKRISMYNINAISTDSLIESRSHGFIITDSTGKYIGSDEAAKLWFPELAEIKIDTYIKNENTSLLVQIGKWNRGEDDNNTILLQSGDMIIEAQHTILKERNNKKIHCVYLRDDTKQQQYTKLVEEYNNNLERDVNAKTLKLSRIQNDIIVSMASIVENRDDNTGGHIARTSDVVRIFVNYLMSKKMFPELTEEVAERIIKAAPLHDFGKIGVPDDILNKPGRFTAKEYDIMKSHSAKGAAIVERILQNSEDDLFKKIAVNVAHYHHEKWDGTGYPTQIEGEKIPFEARIMALADVFDALVSKRIYKESYSYEKAFTIIEESCGNHFDPVLCKAFLECREKLIELYDSYND